MLTSTQVSVCIESPRRSKSVVLLLTLFLHKLLLTTKAFKSTYDYMKVNIYAYYIG